MQSPKYTTQAEIVYIPMDRRQALAQHQSLPDRVVGSALFADISGFTPLTEGLALTLGPQRGAEALTNYLNQVFDALIGELHNYGGSVISFGGDAMTCWFGDDNGLRAIACALAMQRVMQNFNNLVITSEQSVSLAMTTAVVSGAARRFLIGDPTIQQIDVLAGASLDRLAAAEYQAERGEVVIDAETAAELGAALHISDWRIDSLTEERFGVVTGLSHKVPITPWATVNRQLLSADQVRAWLLPPVYERLQAAQGGFMAELRPVVALFLRFEGIDYDEDEQAGNKLDAYFRWVQSVLVKYDVYPLQLTVGDKGSSLYTAFGAPTAHEDDAVRAVTAALELSRPPAELAYIKKTHIGISQGRLWAGAYGGTLRRTYGILGDDVNLAARLMQAAQAGQILVSKTVQQATDKTFDWHALPAISVKGKAAPIAIYEVERARVRQSHHWSEDEYSLPMVGRQSEFAALREALNQVLAGQGQIIGLKGVAGVGKSRLVADVLSYAMQLGFTAYASECQSYGTSISYQVWRPIWRDFYGLDAGRPLTTQIALLENELNAIDPMLSQRLPLLGPALNLPLPDNNFTHSFDAKLRKASLESLLLTCLQTRAQTTPFIIVLEDAQWLDPLSIDLLEEIGRTIIDLPIIILVVYRPPELQNLSPPWASLLPNFTEITLSDFTYEEVRQFINLKLAQAADTRQDISGRLVQQIMARTEGNPFYIEELLNYLHAQGINPNDEAALNQLELPASLHSLILSRIDQLSESQKITVKVASIIGRLFKRIFLWGAYPAIGDPEIVEKNLEALIHLDFVGMDKPEPESVYFFKQIVTQEVAYESLPYATRAELHEHLAWYIEQGFADSLDQYIDLLTFHYERSENTAKKREYLLKAAELAQREYANETAIEYYQRVLPLLADQQKVDVMLKLGEVLQFVGNWVEADSLYREALSLAEALGDQLAIASCEAALGELLHRQGVYDEAWLWLERALTTFNQVGDARGEAQTLHSAGTVAVQQGDYDTARARYEQSIAIRRTLDDKPGIAALLNNLGIIARRQGRLAMAQSLYEQSLAIVREVDHKWSIAMFLNNLGNLSLQEGDTMRARTQLEEAVAIQREIGDRFHVALFLHTLGNVARSQGEFREAQSLYAESLRTNRALDHKAAMAELFEDIGVLGVSLGKAEEALPLIGAAQTLRQQTGAPLSPSDQKKLAEMLTPASQHLVEPVVANIIATGTDMSLNEAIDCALILCQPT